MYGCAVPVVVFRSHCNKISRNSILFFPIIEVWGNRIIPARHASGNLHANGDVDSSRFYGEFHLFFGRFFASGSNHFQCVGANSSWCVRSSIDGSKTFSIRHFYRIGIRNLATEVFAGGAQSDFGACFYSGRHIFAENYIRNRWRWNSEVDSVILSAIVKRKS